VVYKPFLISAMSRAHRIICVSPVERDMLSNRFAIDLEKIRIIPNGVGTDLADIKRGHPDQLRILSVGRFDLHHKKTDKLIRAFKILESKIEAKLVLVGSGPDKHEIIKLIEALDLDEKVELKSDLTREELVQEYSNSCCRGSGCEVEGRCSKFYSVVNVRKCWLRIRNRSSSYS